VVRQADRHPSSATPSAVAATDFATRNGREVLRLYPGVKGLAAAGIEVVDQGDAGESVKAR